VLRFLFFILFGIWLVHVFRRVVVRSICRRACDRVIGAGLAPAEYINRLIASLHSLGGPLGFLSYQDRIRIEKLLAIRNKSNHDIKHVDAKVYDTPH